MSCHVTQRLNVGMRACCCCRRSFLIQMNQLAVQESGGRLAPFHQAAHFSTRDEGQDDVESERVS